MKQKFAHVIPVTLLALPASWVLAQTGTAEAKQVPTKTGAPAQAAPAQAAPAQGAPAQDTKTTTAPLTKGQTPGKVTGKPPMGPQNIPGGVPGGMPKPAKPAWKQFKLNPKTTIFLDYTESNPDAIISIFSRTSGITILKDPSFKVPLTVTSAKAVKLDEAFEIFNTVLGLNGYELQKQGNLMLVARKQPPQQPSFQPPPPPPQPVVKTYVLQNANASQVARVVTEVFGPAAAGGGGGNQGGNQFPGGVVFGGPPQFGGGGAPGGGAGGNFKVTSEDYSNSVIVKAMPDEQTKIEALIKDLDHSTASPLVTELFELKYVPADQAVTAIEDVLTANTPQGRGAKKADNNQNQGYFYSYNPFGGGSNNQHTAGGQSATAIKATNSVSVNATKENIELIRSLLKNLDQPAKFVGTTFVVKLQNAKASDVADLLNKVLTPKQNNNNDNGVFFFSDFYDPNSSRNKKDSTDIGENGEILNVRDISGKVQIAADPNTNSLLIVTQPSNMRMIQGMIDKLDTVAEQVMIETVIVEANLDKTDKLGIEYTFPSRTLFGDRNTTGAGAVSYGLQTATGGLTGLRYTINSNDYQIFLNAVQTDTRFKVLDTPRIFTSNNVKAEIDVSQKLPYITTTTQNALGNITSNYTFEPVGVILTVTPRITANGQVTMDVIQKADDLQGFTDFNAPIINHRQATTTVSVTDGETIVLGGIIRHTETQNNSKVPLLGDIPLLGQVFRNKNTTRSQTELMVFLTPHIVHNNDDAQKLRKDSTNDLTKPSQDILKKVIPPR